MATCAEGGLRARHVKCDETHPKCMRCLQLHLECGGYLMTRAQKPKYTVGRLVPLVPKAPMLSMSTVNPSASIPGDDLERRYFQLFNETLAVDLCGHFETPLWTRVVPQQCHHEPALRHAIFALSALYKSAACRVNATEENNNDEHLKFALVENGKAIKSLRQSLSDGYPQLRLTLMVSLLFSCFESFHCNWETAIQQVYSGINMFQFLKDDKTGTETHSLATLDPEISRTLARLKLQIFSFLAMYPMYDHPFIDLDGDVELEHIPDQFDSLTEGFSKSINPSTRFLQFIRTAARCGDVEGLRSSLLEQQQFLYRLLHKWINAHEPVFLRTCHDITSREYLGALHLRVFSFVFETMLSTSMCREETVFDKYTERFQQIVFYSQHLLKKDHDLRGLDGLRVQCGLGLTFCLFYTATRCRDFYIRRETIALLKKWPRIDGIWDSLQAAKIASWIVSIEEENCENDVFIPEEHRVRMNSLKITLQDGKIGVECMQGPLDGALIFRRVSLP
jgi:hypothetical protein